MKNQRWTLSSTRLQKLGEEGILAQTSLFRPMNLHLLILVMWLQSTILYHLIIGDAITLGFSYRCNPSFVSKTIRCYLTFVQVFLLNAVLLGL